MSNDANARAQAELATHVQDQASNYAAQILPEHHEAIAETIKVVNQLHNQHQETQFMQKRINAATAASRASAVVGSAARQASTATEAATSAASEAAESATESATSLFSSATQNISPQQAVEQVRSAESAVPLTAQQQAARALGSSESTSGGASYELSDLNAPPVSRQGTSSMKKSGRSGSKFQALHSFNKAFTSMMNALPSGRPSRQTSYVPSKAPPFTDYDQL